MLYVLLTGDGLGILDSLRHVLDMLLARPRPADEDQVDSLGPRCEFFQVRLFGRGGPAAESAEA